MTITVRKRKGGLVSYRVRKKICGKCYDKSFPRKYDAEERERSLERSTGYYPDPKYTLEEGANDWDENHVEVRKSDSSKRSDRQMLRDVILPALGKRPMCDIRPEEIDAIIYQLQRKGLKPATVNRYLEVIRAIYNFAKKRRKTDHNVMDAVKMLKTPPPVMNFLNESEARRLLTFTRNKYQKAGRSIVHFLWVFLINSGCRVGEALGLDYRAIDMQNRLITISRILCNVTHTIKETTKSNRVRHVPINDSLFDELVKMNAEARTGLVFTISGTPFDHSNVAKWFRRDLKEAGVKQIRIHDLRHTFASHWVMNGGAIYVLQAILGHSDLKTTQRYAHLSKTFLVDKANTVNFSVEGNIIRPDFQKVAQI